MKTTTNTLIGLMLVAGLASCVSARTPNQPGVQTSTKAPDCETGPCGPAPAHINLTPPKGSRLEARVYDIGERSRVFAFDVDGRGPERVVHVIKDGQDVRVESNAGKVTATHNGKDVPQDRITIKDGRIQVRDENGNTVLNQAWDDVLISEFPRPTIAPLPPLPPMGTTMPGFMDLEGDTPKVMLGVTMDDADESLVQHLGLPAGVYAVIDSVPADLPAAKAGIQPRDVIVKFDGQSPASAAVIRDVVRSKNPGDTIDVEVARKGQRIKMKVALESFDVKRFPSLGQFFGGENEVQMRERLNALTGRIDKDVQEKINKAMASGRAPDARLHEKMIGITRGNGQTLLLTAPENQAKLEDRLSKLEAQLERLEDMLRRMEQRSANPPSTGGGGTGNPIPFVSCIL